MSTVPPPGAQPPQPPPSTAQAALTAVVRDPSPEVARLAAGTRVEGTVLPQQAAPQPSTPATQVETSRAAVQALQTAVDASKAGTAAQRSDTAAAQKVEAAARSTPQSQSQAQQASAQSTPQVTVRTPVGDVTLRTPLPIPEGARLSFEVANSTGNQVTVRLATLNGQPVQQALLQIAADRAATPQPSPTAPALPPASGVLAQSTTLPFGQMWTPSGAVPLAQAGPLNAFVLLGNAPPGQPTGPIGVPGQPQAQTGFVTGSDLTIRITSVTQATPGATPPQGPASGMAGSNTPGIVQQAITPGGPTPTGATPVPGQPGPQTPAGATPTAASPTAAGQAAGIGVTQTTGAVAGATNPTQQPPGPGSLLPTGAGTPQGLRLVGSQGWPPPPFMTPSQVQETPVRLAMTGIVTAQSTAAQTVIQTPDGTIQLGNRVNLPPGTTVTLDVLTQAGPRTDATGSPVQSAPPPPSAGLMPFAAGAAWPALTEALQVLQRSDPQAAQLLANTIPDGGPRTVVAALSFIQAMRSGDPRQWPGDNSLRALERSGPRGAHLARALAGETAQLGAQVRETAGEWRSTPVPWNANGQIEKINLITRREDARDDDDNAKTQKGSGPGLRFLLDLDFSNLGSLQLDGMVHEETKGFDMILRSHQTLDDDIRRDLTGLFVNSVQAVGLKGGLTFQVTKKFSDPIGASEPMKLERDGVWA